MRLRDKINHIRHENVTDGYGGYTQNEVLNEVIRATVSISNNELKPLPSGRGFSRVATIIVDADAGLIEGDYVVSAGTTYVIQGEIALTSTVFRCFKGYEL